MEMRNASNVGRDRGFTLVEMLIVVIVLGTLAAVSMLSVRGLSRTGEQGACAQDRQTLATAADVYMFDQRVDTIPGATSEERVATLVEAGLLRDSSEWYGVEPDGTVVAVARCG
jgi:prepilin-type N-terminal cleavage/methylation domain-containing protein